VYFSFIPFDSGPEDSASKGQLRYLFFGLTRHIFKRSGQQCSKFLMLLATSLQNFKRCGQQRLKFLTAVADSV
jgi:hypothetical protein